MRVLGKPGWTVSRTPRHALIALADRFDRGFASDPRGAPRRNAPALVRALTVLAVVGLLLFDFFAHVRRAPAPSPEEASV